MREIPKLNDRVVFAKSTYVVVKVNKSSVNIKQTFSLGLVYENIPFKDIKIVK